MPQDGDRRTEIAQENWQRTSTATSCPVRLKPSVKKKKGKGVENCAARLPVSQSVIPLMTEKELESSNLTVFTADEKEICTQQKLIRQLEKRMHSNIQHFQQQVSNKQECEGCLFIMHTN